MLTVYVTLWAGILMAVNFPQLMIIRQNRYLRNPESDFPTLMSSRVSIPVFPVPPLVPENQNRLSEASMLRQLLI